MDEIISQSATLQGPDSVSVLLSISLEDEILSENI